MSEPELTDEKIDYVTGIIRECAADARVIMPRAEVVDAWLAAVEARAARRPPAVAALIAEIEHLRAELARTEGDLAVACEVARERGQEVERLRAVVDRVGNDWVRGYHAATSDAREAIAGEDTVEWARQATGSMISLPAVMKILDGMDPDRG